MPVRSYCVLLLLIFFVVVLCSLHNGGTHIQCMCSYVVRAKVIDEGTWPFFLATVFFSFYANIFFFFISLSFFVWKRKEASNTVANHKKHSYRLSTAIDKYKSSLFSFVQTFSHLADDFCLIITINGRSTLYYHISPYPTAIITSIR